MYFKYSVFLIKYYSFSYYFLHCYGNYHVDLKQKKKNKIKKNTCKVTLLL